MKHFGMKRLIRRYELPLQLVTEEPAGYDSSTGIYKKTDPKTEAFRGALLPVPERIMYATGGRYTQEDRVLYATRDLPLKGKVIYKGAAYSVEEKFDFTDYADFFEFVVKRVSAFD